MNQKNSGPLCRAGDASPICSRTTAPGNASVAFTLLEVLIALSIFALVVTAIYSSWTAILRGSKVGLEAAAAVQRARITMQVIEEALTSAQMFKINAGYYGFIAENGDEATMSFVARLPEAFPRSGNFRWVGQNVRRVTFSVEAKSNDEKVLVLRQTPILMEMDQDEEEHPVVLARRVKEFRLEFLDPKVGGPSGAATSFGVWIDDWTQTNQLPKLVRVSLQLERDNAHGLKAWDEFTRIVSLPAVGVQEAWQVPNPANAPGSGPRGGGPPPNRTQPGASPGPGLP